MAYRAMKYEGGVIFILFKWHIEPWNMKVELYLFCSNDI